jgi:alanine racemase
MPFNAQALIDLAALRHNLDVARHQAPNSQILAVIKANAYGHGLQQIAHTLALADAFAVARIEEAMALRKLGETKDILVMGGAYRANDVRKAAVEGITLAVHQSDQVALLESLSREPLPHCLIKVDSGMHRLGFLPDQVEEAVSRLQALDCLGEKPILMTHMANADDRSDPKTDQQWACFETLLHRFDARGSAANSAVVMSRPEMQGAWVRPGIMLYGVSPFIDSLGPEENLRPVMTLQTKLVSVKTIPKGESVGYGATWQCPEDMPVGVAAIGYGDGYPRHAPSGTPVLVNGVEVPLIGRVSMDMITLDLRPCPQACPGDTVTLWGQGLPAERIARAAGTIAYELFTGITRRVQLDYLHGQS